MAFTVKDFWGYADDATQNKDMVLLVAKPDGGGGFNLVNMTKEEFFALTGQSIDYSTGASADIMTFNGDSYKLIYLAGGNLLAQLASFGVTINGTSNEIQLNSSGNLKVGRSGGSSGSITITDNTSSVTAIINRTAECPSNVQWAFLEDQQTTYTEATEDDTVSLDDIHQQILILDATAGDLTDYTINYPSAPLDGATVEIAIYGTIDTIDNSSSNTIDKPITTSVGDLTYGKWTWDDANDTWWKVNAQVGGGSQNINTVAVSNAGSTDIPNHFNGTTILATGSGTVFTVNLPPVARHGQIVKIITHVGIASFILQVSGTATINRNVSGTVVINDSWEWQYDEPNDTWWRIR